MLLKGTTQSSSTILRLTICAAHASTPLCYSWRTANIASWGWARRRSDSSYLDKLIKMCNAVPLHPATVLVSSSGNSAEKDIASWAPCHNLCSRFCANYFGTDDTPRALKNSFSLFVIFHSWTCTRANIFSIRRYFSRICIRCPFPALIIVWILN